MLSGAQALDRYGMSELRGMKTNPQYLHWLTLPDAFGSNEIKFNWKKNSENSRLKKKKNTKNQGWYESVFSIWTEPHHIIFKSSLYLSLEWSTHSNFIFTRLIIKNCNTRTFSFYSKFLIYYAMFVRRGAPFSLSNLFLINFPYLFWRRVS